MRINLLPAKRCAFNPGHHVSLTSTEPFVDNARAILIHRVRYATIYTSNDKRWGPHLTVINWCGNHFSSSKHLTLVAAPAAGKFVCVRCEENAINAGLPSSSALAGHHVCVGSLKAFNACPIHRELDQVQP